MKKSILIVGAGSGLSHSVAKRFAKEGFSIHLISRSSSNLEELKGALQREGVHVNYATADAGNAAQLKKAIRELTEDTSGFDAVLYNAAVLKAQDIMEEDSADLMDEFAVNVAGALLTIQSVYEGLKHKRGAFLLTGGGLGVSPMASYGSLSIGKAGIRSLAYQLHERLKDEGIYVGLLTVAGFIRPDSDTHSPHLLADLFWQLYEQRNDIELHQ